MAELSWCGVHYCFEALRVPRPFQAASDMIAHTGRIQPSTASRYLSAARQLGLLRPCHKGLLHLAGDATSPEELLLMSTLVRLFRRWQQIEPHPFHAIRDGKVSLGTLESHSLSLLHSADALARHVTRIPEELPPDAALMLELARLWGESGATSQETRLWRATDAFELFRSVLCASAPGLGPEITVTRFIRACASLYSRNLVRLGIVQHAFERDAPYKPFLTEIGYLKSIYDPRPFEVARHAQPVQGIRRRISATR